MFLQLLVYIYALYVRNLYIPHILKKKKICQLPIYPNIILGFNYYNLVSLLFSFFFQFLYYEEVASLAFHQIRNIWKKRKRRRYQNLCGRDLSIIIAGSLATCKSGISLPFLFFQFLVYEVFTTIFVTRCLRRIHPAWN